ncbi:hypothetical protein H2200_003705 [Cladophialophora chaetospira]|uniref:Zn(2)-C6 fungal-type domain-containing protein n=1 Tax=Cladophialophora chaetospira TaxID=386627 RepID=A0AA39CLC7_9EURO|nr:hypothetical protein H2200_003705 [Cladophialophora chaetospira]
MDSSRRSIIDYVDNASLAPLSVTLSNENASTQACDRCRTKKIKCNLRRPACSRCAEDSIACLYTFIRRKRGPAKGSRRKRSNTGSNASPQQQSTSALTVPQLDPPVEHLLPQQVYQSSSTVLIPISTASEPEPKSVFNIDFSLSSGITTNKSRHSSDQERQVLEEFFSHVQPCVPFVRQQSFMRRYERGDVDRDLLDTILAVVAKIRGRSHVWTDSSPDHYLQGRLNTQAYEKETTNSFASLDKAIESCILAFYEFHQYPGNKAWLRIARLARGAYQCGLHQLDNRDQFALYDSEAIADDEVEEWRQIWWCIYCFDSYSNITAATPFLIEVDSIRTALLSTHPSLHSPSTASAPLFLPAEPDVLWKTAKEIVTQGRSTISNLQMVTQAALRKASTLARLWRLNPSDRLQNQLAMMETHVSAIRLALPSRLLSVARDVAANESSADHHGRLTYLLELHSCRLTLALHLPQEDETEWLRNWQLSLEICEDIVGVVKQWNPEICSSVDPAVCFIVSSTMIVLHLHGKEAENPELDFRSKLTSYEDLLRLFMEQFALLWNLPRFLVSMYSMPHLVTSDIKPFSSESFDKLCSILPGTLTTAEIQRLLRRHQGLLHQSWFQMVSLEPDSVHPQILPVFDTSWLPEWDLTDWAFFHDGPGLVLE